MNPPDDKDQDGDLTLVKQAMGITTDVVTLDMIKAMMSTNKGGVSGGKGHKSNYTMEERKAWKKKQKKAKDARKKAAKSRKINRKK